MRRLFCVVAMAVLSASGLASAAEEVAPISGTCGSYRCACCTCSAPWYATADAFLLTRDDDARNTAVVLDSDTRQTLMSTGGLDFDWEAGPRLMLGYHLNACSSLEIGYLGLHDWHADSMVVGQDRLSIPGDLGLASLDLNRADVMWLNYGSEWHHVELNYIRRTDYLAWLVGFRYVNLDEQLTIRGLDFDSGQSDYRTTTSNHLYGCQIGGIWQGRRGRLGLDLTGKVGLYGNAAEQHNIVGDLNNTLMLRNANADNGQTACVAELGLFGTLQLNRCLLFRAGYELIWLEGLALAPDQLDFTDTASSGTTIDTTGSVFFHGARIGLEARW